MRRVLLALTLTIFLIAGVTMTASAASRGRGESAETSAAGAETTGQENAKGRGQENTAGTESSSESESESDDERMILYRGIVFGVVALVAAVLAISQRKKGAASNRFSGGNVSADSVGSQNQRPNNQSDSFSTAPWPPAQYGNAVPPQMQPGNPENAGKASPVFLCCEGGVLKGRSYPVTEQVMTIGRDPGCDIRYPADTKGVSRRHCQVFRKNGSVMILDTGSTSGTVLRGKGRLTPNVPAAVREGDLIYLGEKKNVFRITSK